MSADPGLFGKIRGRIEESAEPEPVGSFSPADLLDLDDRERPLVQLVMRAQPVAVSDAAAQLGLADEEITELVARLVGTGALVSGADGLRIGTWRSRRRPPGGLWARLGDL